MKRHLPLLSIVLGAILAISAALAPSGPAVGAARDGKRPGPSHRAQEPAPPPATQPQRRPTTRPTLLPFTRPATPVTTRSERLKQPAVRLSVNGDVDLEIPQGWPLLIHATVFGGVDHPFEFQRDGVILKITDAKGAKADWPVKPASAGATSPATGPARVSAGHARGVSIQWVVTDTSAIALGKYTMQAIVDGANSHTVAINVVAALPKATAEQLSQRFMLQARVSIAAGDHAGALQLAEDRIKAQPRDVLAHHIRADALAAAGRRDEALKAYGKALTLFQQQNPKSPEPPRALLQAIEQVEAQR